MTNRAKILKRLLIIGVVIVMICGVAFLIVLNIIADAASSMTDFVSADTASSTTSPSCIGSWSPDNPTAVEISAHLTLPPSAENLFAHSVAVQDCFVFVSFDMAANEMETFLASTDVSELETVRRSQLTSFFNLIQHDVDWYFDDDEMYLYGEDDVEAPLYAQQIVIAHPDSDIHTVYVVVFLG